MALIDDGGTGVLRKYQTPKQRYNRIRNMPVRVRNLDEIKRVLVPTLRELNIRRNQETTILDRQAERQLLSETEGFAASQYHARNIRDSILESGRFRARGHETDAWDTALKLTGEGLKEFDKRIVSPSAALGTQLVATAGSPITVPLPEDMGEVSIPNPLAITSNPLAVTTPIVTASILLSELFNTNIGITEKQRPERWQDFVNPITATYDEQEQAKAQAVLDELDPVTRTAAMLVFDPTNLLPVVGFGPEVGALLRTAKTGGAEGTRALRTLLTDVKLRDDLVRGAKELLANEQGSFRLAREGKVFQKDATVNILGGTAEGKTGLIVEGLQPGKTTYAIRVDDTGEIVHLQTQYLEVTGKAEGRAAELAAKRRAADKIQNALDFSDKAKLQKLGIDPQTIDDPTVLELIREKAPEIASKIEPKITKLPAQKIPGKKAPVPTPVKVDHDEVFRDTFENEIGAGAVPARKVDNKRLKPPTTVKEAKAQLDAVEERINQLQDDIAETTSDAKAERLQEQSDELEEYASSLQSVVDDVEEEAALLEREAKVAAKKEGKAKPTKAEVQAKKEEIAGEAKATKLSTKPVSKKQAVKDSGVTPKAKKANAAAAKSAEKATPPVVVKVKVLRGSGKGPLGVRQLTTGVGDILKWRPRGDGIHFINVFVPEAYRGQGRAQALMARMFADAAEQVPNAVRMTADVKTPEGASLMYRFGATFSDQLGDEILSLEQAMRAASFGRGELPVATIDLTQGMPTPFVRHEAIDPRRALMVQNQPILLGPEGTYGVVKETAHVTHIPEIQRMNARVEEIRASLHSFAVGSDERLAAVQELEQIARQMESMRQADAIAVQTLSFHAERATGFAHERVTPVLPDLDEVEKTAFGVVGWQRKVMGWVNGRGTLMPTRMIDPSTVHESSYIGRKYVAFERLSEMAEANTELGMRVLRGYSNGKGQKVFDLTAEGIERTTGKDLDEILENWNKYKDLFSEEQRGFVELYDRVRLDVLEDARKLGLEIPDAWTEYLHVWRQVKAIRGTKLQAAIRGGYTGSKPGSFHARVWEMLEEGRRMGVEYNRDFMQVAENGLLSMRRYAVERAFVKEVTGKGRLISRWVPAQLRRDKADAAHRLLWANRVRRYGKDSVMGFPARPTLRNTLAQEVPADLKRLVDEIDEASFIKDVTQRRNKIRELNEQVEAAVNRERLSLARARGELETAVNRVNKVRVGGEPFGTVGEVEVGLAPPSLFPEFQSRLFLKDDLDYIERVWRKSAPQWLRTSAQVSDVFRVGATAVDPGFWFIHGLGALGMDIGNAPLRLLKGKAPTAIWGKSVWRSMRAAISKGAIDRYWGREVLRDPEGIGEFIRYYRTLTSHGAISDDFAGAVVKGGLADKLTGHVPVVGSTVNRAERAFAFYMDSFAYESWKALKGLAKNDIQLEELGAMLRGIVGKSSTRGLGVGEMQRLAERAFVMWAPAYTRGGFSILFKAMTDPTSFGGRQAIKALAGIGASATLLGAGLIFAKQMVQNGGDIEKTNWEDLGADLQSFWDITNSSKFWTTRIGEGNFGLGGTYRSNVSMLTRLSRAAIEDPESFNPFDPDARFMVNWNNPFIRAWRAKSSPLTGQAFNILSGKDYLGFQIESPSQYFRLGEDIMPFAVQAYLQAEGGWKGKLGAGAAEFFGFRSYPVSKKTLYYEAAESEAGVPWEELKDSGQLSLMRDDPENFPKTAAAWEAYEEELRNKGDEIQAARDVQEDAKLARDDKLANLANGIQWNRPGGGVFYKEQRPLILAETRQSFELAAAALGVDLDDMDESESKDVKLLSQYYETNLEDFLGPDNQPDFERYYDYLDSLKKQMSPLAQDAINRRKLDYSKPEIVQAEQRRMAATEKLQEWYDIPKYKDLTIKESAQVDEYLDTASKVRDALMLRGVSVDRNEVIRLMLTTGYGDTHLLSYAFLATKTGTADMIKETRGNDMVLANPYMAVFYPFLFDTLSEELQAEWIRLHSHNK